MGGLSDPAVLEGLVRRIAARRVEDEQVRDEVLSAVRHLVPVRRVELVGRCADLRPSGSASDSSLSADSDSGFQPRINERHRRIRVGSMTLGHSLDRPLRLGNCRELARALPCGPSFAVRTHFGSAVIRCRSLICCHSLMLKANFALITPFSPRPRP